MNPLLQEFKEECIEEGVRQGEKKGVSQGVLNTLYSLVQKGLLTKTQALSQCSDKKELEMMFKNL